MELLTDRRQSFLKVLAEQGGGALSVRDAALDLAEVLMGEMLKNPIAALTRKTLGGTAEQADGCVSLAVGGGLRAKRPDRPPAVREGVG